MTFIQQLHHRWHHADTLLCVGLDPEPARLPAMLRDDPDPVFAFCRAIVDATAPYVCAFKPQIAHFAAQRAEGALERLITHVHNTHRGIPVILDSKRGDIGSTAQHYAHEAFERYRADAVTVNPYLGRDSVQPFLDHADKGAWWCCAAPPIRARANFRTCVSTAARCTSTWRSASRTNGTAMATVCWWSAPPGRLSS